MNRSTYRFTLDLQKHQSQMSIAAFQYDTAVRLYISLTDGGNPYFIEDGVRAVLYGKKPNDEPLIQNCMIEGNTRIVYDFNFKTTDIEGVVNCKIRLYKDKQEILTAPRFIIVVGEILVKDADVVFEDKPLSAYGLSALDQIFASENERAEAEIERDGAEDARAEAEIERDAAETARAEAEEKRVQEFEEIKTHLNRKLEEQDGTIAKQHEQISTEVETRLSAQDEMLAGVGESLDEIIELQNELLALEEPSAEILRLGD